MNAKKFIFGLLGIGALGGLTFFFSKKAEAAVNAEQTQTGTYNPLAVAARAQRLVTAKEINDFHDIWGIGPDYLQCIENWDCLTMVADHIPRPTQAEARIRLPDLCTGRGIDWSYVSDFYTKFPQYNPSIVTRTTIPGTSMPVTTTAKGAQSSEPSSNIPHTGPSMSLRRSVGQSRFNDMPKGLKEEMRRDFYCVLKYGWDRWNDTANGKATLLGLGGFPGFCAQWQIPTPTAQTAMYSIRRAQY